jgi:hypothetical protein
MYYTNDQLIMPLIEHASKELDLQIGTIIELESEKLEEKRSLKLC